MCSACELKNTGFIRLITSITLKRIMTCALLNESWLEPHRVIDHHHALLILVVLIIVKRVERADWVLSTTKSKLHFTIIVYIFTSSEHGKLDKNKWLHYIYIYREVQLIMPLLLVTRVRSIKQRNQNINIFFRRRV